MAAVDSTPVVPMDVTPVEEEKSVNFKSFISSYMKGKTLHMAGQATILLDEDIVEKLNQVCIQAAAILNGRQTMRVSDIEVGSKIIFGLKIMTKFRHNFSVVEDRLKIKGEKSTASFQAKSGLALPASRINYIVKAHCNRASKDCSIALAVVVQEYLEVISDMLQRQVGERPKITGAMMEEALLSFKTY